MKSLDRIFTLVVYGKTLEAVYEKHKTTLSGVAGPGAVGKTVPEGQQTHREKPPKSVNRLIMKHPDDGDYFYNGQRIIITKGTVYYDVFDILFLHAGQEGSLSYKEIDDELVKRKHSRIEDAGKRGKRIQNAISEQNGFFKYAKIGVRAMKNKTLDGRPLVEVVRSNGLKFNNPIL
jgi:hypothetical protein